MNDTLKRVLGRAPPGKTAKSNAAYAVLVEAVQLRGSVQAVLAKAASNKNLEQDVVSVAGKMDLAQGREWLGMSLKVALLEGVDSPVSGSLSGAATFRTGVVLSSGDKLSVGCLVRLEASDGNSTASERELCTATRASAPRAASRCCKCKVARSMIAAFGVIMKSSHPYTLRGGQPA
ncbi:hypothetical protein BBJ28_00009350 [Nothophytophthora sp. Chile5]|nr:hypothetical protein BBJ28_00009350 [Nothophytophthora sp. Chile5]